LSPVLPTLREMAYSSAIMFGLGMGEILVILIIVLIFGANKLPEIGSGLGRAIRDFRKEIKKPDEIDVTPGKKSDSPGEEKSG
jgi:sec-independent protein translocase protein TatA